MKREYIAPETEEIHVLMESVMNTDSDGLDDDFCAKEQKYDFFDMDDDQWGSDDMDLWGEE